MPLIHHQTFPIFYDHCDPQGYVHNAAYLRLMQETAFAASAAAGYDFTRYQQIKRTWLIRETDIAYLHPLRYGDSVTIKTWVVDFRRVRSRRAYEMVRVADGVIVARAHTEWVFLDAQTLRPATIPPEMMAAFFPEGMPPPAERRPSVPPVPPPPAGVFTQIRRVEWRDLDMVGHVNNANYIAYLEDCAIQVAAASGWPVSRLFTQQSSILTHRYRLTYHQSAVMDDQLAISTWFASTEPTRATRYYHITRPADGTIILQAQADWGWVDMATQRPQPIPDDFLNALASNRADRS